MAQTKHRPDRLFDADASIVASHMSRVRLSMQKSSRDWLPRDPAMKAVEAQFMSFSFSLWRSTLMPSATQNGFRGYQAFPFSSVMPSKFSKDLNAGKFPHVEIVRVKRGGRSP